MCPKSAIDTGIDNSPDNNDKIRIFVPVFNMLCSYLIDLLYQPGTFYISCIFRN
jgi:hypothetical protein